MDNKRPSGPSQPPPTLNPPLKNDPTDKIHQ
jgi:hypothetical protein